MGTIELGVGPGALWSHVYIMLMQAEYKIRKLKTALKNSINLHQTNWLTLLPNV